MISSHNQYYERTYPLSFNKDYEQNTDKRMEPKPIITAHYRDKYPETNGIVFLTVGTAGDKLDKVKKRPGFYVIREEYHGFLNLEIANNGKTLVGTFHTNDGKIIDKFELNEL